MSIALNSLRNILVRSVTVVFILLTGVMTARLLEPSGRGVYALVTVYAGVTVALLGGVGTAAGYHISNLKRPIPGVVASVAVLALLTGTAALALALIAYWVVGTITGEAPVWLVIIGAAQPGLLVGAALTWAFLGADDHTNYSYAILAPSLFTLTLMALLLILFPRSTSAALLAWVAAQYAVVGWLWWRGRGVWTPLPLERVTLASMRELVGFSLVSGVANVVSMLNYRIDFLITAALLGAASAGVYSVAVLLVEGLFFISQAVGVAIWARVGAASRADAAWLVTRSVRCSLALMTAGGALCFVCAGIVIPLVFGHAFAGAVAPFRWFVPGVVAWGMANLLAAYYTNQLGRPRVPLAIAALSLAISIVLCVALIPIVGLSGGAIATSVSYISAIAVELAMFRQDAGVTWRELLVPDAVDRDDALAMLRALTSFVGGRVTVDEQAYIDEDDEVVLHVPETPPEPLFRRIRTGQRAVPPSRAPLGSRES